MTKVFQAQIKTTRDGDWHPLTTKSGGTYCDTLRGARIKVARLVKNNWWRIVSFDLVEEDVVEVYVPNTEEI